MNQEEFWIVTFLAAIVSGKTVEEARAMADEAVEIDRSFD